MKVRSLLAIMLTLAICNCDTYSVDTKGDLFSDREIRERIVGVWVVDSKSVNGTIRGKANFKKDGTVFGESFLVRSDIKNGTTITYEGTWDIKDGYIIITVSKTSNPKILPNGLVTRDKVISINNLELVYETENGKLINRKRSKDLTRE